MSRQAKDYNCENCHHRHCDEKGELPGSNGPAPFLMFELEGVIESRVCLLPMVTPWARQMLALYDHYKNNHLAIAGGVLDQPAGYLEAMRVIDGAVNKSISDSAK